MNIIIRKAMMKDLKDIQNLNFKLFEKEHKEYDSSLNLDWTFGKVGTKYFQDMISKERGCVLIAIVDDKIVGYLCGGLKQKKVESCRNLLIVAELENTFVLDEFRSKGIGKQLYSKFMEWCKMQNVEKIRVGVFAQNELAIKFYRNNNFKDYTLILESDL